jgi:hypothetical protein
MTRFRERSWPALALSAGGLMLLASLYLPWQSAGSCREEDYGFGNQGGAVCGLLSLFSDGRSIEGLSPEVGRAAALFALPLAAVAAAAWVRPSLAPRLPLGRCALLAGYFGVAVVVQTRSDAHQQGPGETFHYAYGVYVGLAATIVILVAVGVERRGELARYRSASRLILLLLVAGLLGAFLLPWVQGNLYVDNQVAAAFARPGIASTAAVVAAALAMCLPLAWSRPGAALAERFGLTAAVALFTGGAAVSFPPFYGHRAYGVWLALGFAGGLLLLALVDGPRSLRPAEPSWRQLAAGSAAALFIGALFLPWERQCYAASRGFGPLGGHCVTMNAWTRTMPAAAAALLALALVVAVLAPRRLRRSVVELAAGFGLLVATLGFSLQEGGGGGFHVEHAYGSTIGFVLAAVLVALALAPSRLPTFDWRRAAVRLAPIAACAAYLTIIVPPLLDVFQEPFHTPPIYPPLSWLTIAGALLGIRLLRLWALQIAGASESPELVLLPIALLALAGIDLIDQREKAATWGRGAIVGLCLLLALLGRIEQRGGLEHIGVPEAVRLDRL